MIWASLGIKGGFVCSAFRRNPAKEQRSGEKCWYLFIQESFANNMYLGAFRNNITRPTELLNQFGGDTPAHTRAEVRAAQGTPGRACGRAAGKAAIHPSTITHLKSRGARVPPSLVSSTGGSPISGCCLTCAEQRPSNVA